MNAFKILDTRSMVLDDETIKTFAKRTFRRGNFSQAMAAAAGMSMRSGGKPVSVFASIGGYQVVEGTPSLPVGHPFCQVTCDGKTVKNVRMERTSKA